MVSIDHSRWQTFVVDNTKENLGALQASLEKGELNGAIGICVNERSWRKKQWIHIVIQVLQRIGAFKSSTSIRGNSLLKDTSLATHTFIINGPMRLEQREEDALQKAQAKLNYRIQSLKQKGLKARPERKKLHAKLKMINEYLNLNKSAQQGKTAGAMVTEAVEGGLLTEYWKFGKDDPDGYTKIIFIKPPKPIASCANKLSLIGASNQISLLTNGPADISAFNFTQGVIAPIIRPTPRGKKSKSKWSDSVASATLDLIKNHKVRKRTGKNKKMICSEFVTRIFQAALICDALGEKQVNTLRHMNEHEALRIIKQVQITQEPILNMKPSGTMPYHWVHLAHQIALQ